MRVRNLELAAVIHSSIHGPAADMIRKYITRQRSLSWTKIIIASGIGVLGGVYVWKPFFESLDSDRPKKIKEE